MDAWLRLNWRQGALIAASVVMALGLLRLGLHSPRDAFERDLLLVLTGAALAAVGKTVRDLVIRSEAYRQGAYTERAKAVQEILAVARDVKAACVHTLCGEPGPEEATIALLQILRHPPAEHLVPEREERVRVLRDALLRLSWHHRVWIGTRGEQAVRRFLDGTAQAQEMKRGEPREQYESAVGRPFGELENALMGDLGYWPR